MIFVGEERSERARAMGVYWTDGRLAAAHLFDALRAAGIDPTACTFVNWFEGEREPVRNAAARGETVIGMGRRVQRALAAEGIAHRALTHPAARGLIRRRDRYRAHVREVLG